MERLVRLGALVMVILLGVCSRPAEANIWDWMEELSGPGPFLGQAFMANMVCFDPDGKHVLTISATPGATCIFVDYRQLHSEGDDRFYQVKVKSTEAGTSILLHRAVEIGAGVGLMHFSSKASDASPLVTSNHFVITFPRLTFMPLRAFGPTDPTKKQWLGFLKVYMKETMITGNLTTNEPGEGNDFVPKPGAAPFKTRHDRVMSMGFIVDLTGLMYIRKR